MKGIERVHDRYLKDTLAHTYLNEKDAEEAYKKLVCPCIFSVLLHGSKIYMNCHLMC